LEHAGPVLAREVAEVDRDAEAAADGHGVAAVLVGAAVAAAVVGPVVHEQSGDRLAGVAQEQGGDRGIHAAGHADDDARRRHQRTERSSESGCRLPARWSATTCQTRGLRWRPAWAWSSAGVSQKART